ncbi:MAG: hypothetical protein JXL81_10890 [Deltaproteobacteria bacterium]|nr:hypothetical protein [Deltaproteobacteria bacterium]
MKKDLLSHAKPQGHKEKQNTFVIPRLIEDPVLFAGDRGIHSLFVFSRDRIYS